MNLDPAAETEGVKISIHAAINRAEMRRLLEAAAAAAEADAEAAASIYPSIARAVSL